VTDDTLARIAAIPKVESLSLTSDKITDRGMALLATIPELESLAVESRNVTAAGYEPLRAMKLMMLVLGRDKRSGQNVDDSFMPVIAKLTQVQYLYLDGTRITDAGLTQLHGATALREIGLTQTEVTAKGIEDLKAALPNCRVFWNAPTRN
jgi:hypothetical protein